MLGNLRLLALSVLVAVPVACIAACSEASRQTSPSDTQRIAGALDNILLCEDSVERTSLVFPHKKHYAPRGQGGSAIGCDVCHHDYEGPEAAPPGSCRTCHAAHDVVVKKKIHTL